MMLYPVALLLAQVPAQKGDVQGRTIRKDRLMMSVLNRMRVVALIPLIGVFMIFVDASRPVTVSSAPFFKPRLAPGERVAQIFSRAISVKGEGFSERVSRVSGSATYVVKSVDSSKMTLDVRYRYDGRVAGKSPVSYNLNTLNTIGDDGKDLPATDASGLLFNPYLWGTPPATLQPGTAWSTKIDRKWELGPRGSQRVKVIAVDAANHTVTLMREGRGSGLFAGEKDQLQMTLDGKEQTVSLIPGESRWYGSTTFREGVVMSDALLVERAQTIVAGSRKLKSVERQYILLNALPERGQDDVDGDDSAAPKS